jgi:hypothetical protein
MLENSNEIHQFKVMVMFEKSFSCAIRIAILRVGLSGGRWYGHTDSGFLALTFVTRFLLLQLILRSLRINCSTQQHVLQTSCSKPESWNTSYAESIWERTRNKMNWECWERKYLLKKIVESEKVSYESKKGFREKLKSFKKVFKFYQKYQVFKKRKTSKKGGTQKTTLFFWLFEPCTSCTLFDPLQSILTFWYKTHREKRPFLAIFEVGGGVS